jgi:cell division protein FtsW
MKGKDTFENNKGPLWAVLQKVEGDKVILIIVLLLILISFLAIFSSTPMLPAQEDRLKTMTSHGGIALFGIIIMFVLYHVKIDWWKPLAKIGFLGSFVLLLMLLMKVNIPGIITTERLNGAVRNFKIAGLQIHVFEIVKVAMVMYVAWAIDAIKNEKITGKGLDIYHRIAELCSRIRWQPKAKFGKKIIAEIKDLKNNSFFKRAFYLYVPTLIISMMIFPGSGSSAVFICAVAIATMLLGDIPIRDIFIAFLIAVLGITSMVVIHKASGGKAIQRVGTMINRVKADYDMERLEGLKGDAYSNMVDTLSQPVSAKLAIHEGGWIGKGIGNSTQKYRVQNIYGDYMYSFIIEEYGLLGGLGILILYVSLLARSSIIARMCSDDFAKYVLGGLAILISGQAFMHIFVNVGIGPMTGETLPLISHGASAFLVFCIAFGIILSISRMAKKKIQTVEDMTAEDKNALQENIDIAAKSKE